MLYKPNFCCNCGEKIERDDWKLLTSRRFCNACATENRRHDNVPKIVVAGGVLALMFGIGTLFGGRSGANPTAQTFSASPAALTAPATRKETREPQPQEAVAPPASASPPRAAVPANAGTTASTKAFYCGATTKKGTPCSRKVKVEGSRCFQHAGKPAAGVGD